MCIYAYAYKEIGNFLFSEKLQSHIHLPLSKQFIILENEGHKKAWIGLVLEVGVQICYM